MGGLSAAMPGGITAENFVTDRAAVLGGLDPVANLREHAPRES